MLYILFYDSFTYKFIGHDSCRISRRPKLNEHASIQEHSRLQSILQASFKEGIEEGNNSF